LKIVYFLDAKNSSRATDSESCHTLSKKVTADLTKSGRARGIDPNVEVRFTDDGVGHLAYFMMWGTIDLSLDGGPAIPVEWVDTCEGHYNPRSNTDIQI
jgi:hypothetical protein